MKRTATANPKTTYENLSPSPQNTQVVSAEESLQAEDLTLLGSGKGEKPRSFYSVPTQAVLNATAPRAARLLQAFIWRKNGYRVLSPGVQRACEYVIDHAIGKAKMKTESTGGILTYAQLAKAALELEGKPREFLAEVEEVSRKVRITIKAPLEAPELKTSPVDEGSYEIVQDRQEDSSVNEGDRETDKAVPEDSPLSETIKRLSTKT